MQPGLWFICAPNAKVFGFFNKDENGQYITRNTHFSMLFHSISDLKLKSSFLLHTASSSICLSPLISLLNCLSFPFPSSHFKSHNAPVAWFYSLPKSINFCLSSFNLLFHHWLVPVLSRGKVGFHFRWF